MTKLLVFVLILGMALSAAGIGLHIPILGTIGYVVVLLSLLGLVSPSLWRAKVAESRIVLWFEEKVSATRGPRRDG